MDATDPDPVPDLEKFYPIHIPEKLNINYN